jgi:hypothetical protein
MKEKMKKKVRKAEKEIFRQYKENKSPEKENNS